MEKDPKNSLKIEYELNLNGNLFKETTYVDGVKHGLCRIWSDKGELIGEMMYEKGLLNGRCLEWMDGKLKSESYSLNDDLHGPYTSYYENGQVKEKAFYKLGKKVGIFQSFHQDGTLWKEHDFGETEDIPPWTPENKNWPSK